MKKLTPEQAWGLNGLMAVSAVRYCLGRSTYIVSDCQEWLCDIWDKLPEKAQTIIQRDVEEAFKSDDEDRASGKEYKTLGDGCDRSEWEQVRKLWQHVEIPVQDFWVDVGTIGRPLIFRHIQTKQTVYAVPSPKGGYTLAPIPTRHEEELVELIKDKMKQCGMLL